jgi:hypothetical protein
MGAVAGIVIGYYITAMGIPAKFPLPFRVWLLGSVFNTERDLWTLSGAAMGAGGVYLRQLLSK